MNDAVSRKQKRIEMSENQWENSTSETRSEVNIFFSFFVRGLQLQEPISINFSFSPDDYG